ncbi:hypothetical protein BDR05DRAFT_439714 [Suillus weaverae]|nr:hypothetical protein BDR05DRAFT_439714 [Suillus weaverae]
MSESVRARCLASSQHRFCILAFCVLISWVSSFPHRFYIPAAGILFPRMSFGALGWLRLLPGGRASFLIPRSSTLSMILGWSPLPSSHTSHQPSDCRRTALRADRRTLVLLLPMCFFDHASGVFTRDPSTRLWPSFGVFRHDFFHCVFSSALLVLHCRYLLRSIRF